MGSIGGIKKYSRVRSLLKHIYLYGFYSREDFECARIKNRKEYDYLVSMLRPFYFELDDCSIYRDGKKYYHFPRNYASSAENALLDSYMLHSMDENDLALSLWIFSSLNCNAHGLKTLMVELELVPSLNENLISQPTLLRRLKDLCECGFLVRTGRTYQTAASVMEALNDAQLEAMYDFIRFAEGVTHPRAPSFFLRRTIERQMIKRGIPFEEYSMPFLLRHNVNHNVLDEDTVYQLLDAIEEKKYISIELATKEQKIVNLTVLPVAVRVDTRHGRWYLLAHNGAFPTLIRVSRIEDVRATMKCDDWESLSKLVLATFENTGCSGGKQNNERVLVEARLHFDSMNIMRQFERELRLGEIVRVDDSYIYRACVRDPGELIPQLRSYAPWVEVLPGIHGLHESIKADLETMLAALEEVQE